ncbi:MAG: hypothetical protein JW882_07575 [Deltaproteobacteria bacterium]|nr:hypothetical protein [Deltaproteobacteria bacterium]
MYKDIRDILQEEIEWTSRWMEEAVITLEQEDLKDLRDKGNEAIFIPKAEREKWSILSAPIGSQPPKQFAGAISSTVPGAVQKRLDAALKEVL